MAELGVDVLLLSVGPDLPYLTGYEAMPLERLTMLVLPREGDATLVVPRLEAPRVVERPDVFALLPWDETDDPIAIVADLVGSAGSVAIGDRTWARFLVDLQGALPASAVEQGQRTCSARSGPARTPPRSRPCGGPVPPSTGSPPSCRPARSSWSAAPRPRCRPSSGAGSSPRATTG